MSDASLPNIVDTEAFALRLRKHALRMAQSGGGSHIGSALSMADIMGVLYGRVLRVDPKDPKWPGRDRFILSKGHAGAGVYASLAERGFFPAELLSQHYKNGSIFSGHVSHKGVPGVEFSTGSLGHGLGIGAGMATQLKRLGGGQRVFVVMSDGECDEGSNWEAIMFAAHYKLDNLIAVVDYNKLQSLAPVSETMNLEPFADKWRAFGWSVHQVDGHDHGVLHDLFDRIPFETGKPSVILADTVKGKGISFMENQVLWHYRSPQGAEFDAAMAELDALEAAANA
ncbi:transketolase [Sphingomonas sp. UNC305MFCol5.2]|uniref:transketolase n=1 Tax=Sphingomonas sp. UNC305MFCol5.2 TaxID=1449076 RepID=UPI0004254570|nr:transketolase [Sphingomonas sp. UNC305MFCol5.2]